jgi:hypothetical protein
MLVGQLKTGDSPSTEDAVRAIMTTDTRPKAARATFKVGSTTYTVWGCAKGAGMIHPNMATMLSVVLTDAGLSAKSLQQSLRRGQAHVQLRQRRRRHLHQRQFVLIIKRGGRSVPFPQKALRVFGQP